MPGDVFESEILDFLYNAFLDAPAFNRAVEDALPTPQHRKTLEREKVGVEKRIAANQSEIACLGKALAKGLVKSEMLIGTQDELLAEKQTLANRLANWKRNWQRFPTLNKPSGQQVPRTMLLRRHAHRDWRES